jgi:hypothetical protein
MFWTRTFRLLPSFLSATAAGLSAYAAWQVCERDNRDKLDKLEEIARDPKFIEIDNKVAKALRNNQADEMVGYDECKALKKYYLDKAILPLFKEARLQGQLDEQYVKGWMFNDCSALDTLNYCMRRHLAELSKDDHSRKYIPNEMFAYEQFGLLASKHCGACEAKVKAESEFTGR